MTDKRPTPRKLTGKKDEIDAFLDKFDTFLFDCDGVLWLGDKLLPKTCETLDMLRDKGKRLVFVTNNSTKSRAAYAKKFEKLGIPVKAEEVFGSAYSTAVYLSTVLKIPKDKRVFVIGESGIEEELEAEGISYFGGTSPELNNLDFPLQDSFYETVGPDPSVVAVICGLDFHLNYAKIAKAHGYLQNPDCHFFATNIDSTYPTHGKLLPGAGCMSAPLSYILKKTPLSFGKPSQAMMDSIEGKFKLDRGKTCMIGDRLNTDIKFGIEGKLGGTLAVLTGVATEQDVLESDEGPDVYLNTLCELLG